MWSKQNVRCITVFCVLMTTSLALAADIPPELGRRRTWKDTRGQSLTAALIDYSINGAVLQSKDGRKVTISLGQLSASDRNRILNADPDLKEQWQQWQTEAAEQEKRNKDFKLAQEISELKGNESKMSRAARALLAETRKAEVAVNMKGTVCVGKEYPPIEVFGTLKKICGDGRVEIEVTGDDGTPKTISFARGAVERVYRWNDAEMRRRNELFEGHRIYFLVYDAEWKGFRPHSLMFYRNALGTTGFSSVGLGRLAEVIDHWNELGTTDAIGGAFERGQLGTHSLAVLRWVVTPDRQPESTWSYAWYERELKRKEQDKDILVRIAHIVEEWTPEERERVGTRMKVAIRLAVEVNRAVQNEQSGGGAQEPAGAAASQGAKATSAKTRVLVQGIASGYRKGTPIRATYSNAFDIAATGGSTLFDEKTSTTDDKGHFEVKCVPGVDTIIRAREEVIWRGRVDNAGMNLGVLVPEK